MTIPGSNIANEQQRIEAVYGKRRKDGKERLYGWHQQSVMFERYRLRSVSAAMLTKLGWRDLDTVEALDVGCGSGGWLRTLLEWGVPPGQLHGIDLLDERIRVAQALSPHLDIQRASGWKIPYPSASMDLVSVHTVLSSILDAGARELLAQEMSRVTKPGGVVMVYDFRFADPRNRDTQGISPAEVQRLFPNLPRRVRSLNLPPPLSRRLAQFSPFLSASVEWLCPWLRTHRIYLMKK